MNYCNTKWNNDGQLSAYDIEGIQAVYGTRQTNNDNLEIASTGNLSIYDELGIDQVWENLNLPSVEQPLFLTLVKLIQKR